MGATGIEPMTSTVSILEIDLLPVGYDFLNQCAETNCNFQPINPNAFLKPEYIRIVASNPVKLATAFKALYCPSSLVTNSLQ